MNLKEIKDYEGHYSFDLNTNQVYSHYRKRYKKPKLEGNGYIRIGLYKNSKEKQFQFHRIIYEVYNGEIPSGYIIDHIDNNTQNNNINNLRLATCVENNCNRKIQKNNLSSGYKNITLTKNNTYRVAIGKNYKKVYRKTFKTLEEAIENRDIKLIEIHGEFHNLG